MENNQDFWLNHINANASGSALAQNCRPNTSIVEFASMVGDVVTKLKTGRLLLDIGAGNGLIAIALASGFERIVAIEPSELYDALVTNSKPLPNIETLRVFAQEADLTGYGAFDAVLMNAVSYIDTNIVQDIFDTIRAHLASRCRILIGDVLDQSYRSMYLKELPDILRTKNMTEQQIAEALTRNQKAAWHSYQPVDKVVLLDERHTILCCLSQRGATSWGILRQLRLCQRTAMMNLRRISRQWVLYASAHRLTPCIP